jgi:hypothetical protein
MTIEPLFPGDTPELARKDADRMERRGNHKGAAELRMYADKLEHSQS